MQCCEEAKKKKNMTRVGDGKRWKAMTPGRATPGNRLACLVASPLVAQGALWDGVGVGEWGLLSCHKNMGFGCLRGARKLRFMRRSS